MLPCTCSLRIRRSVGLGDAWLSCQGVPGALGSILLPLCCVPGGESWRLEWGLSHCVLQRPVGSGKPGAVGWTSDPLCQSSNTFSSVVF